MVDLPTSIHSLLTATIQERDDTYVIEIPKREVDNEVLTEGENEVKVHLLACQRHEWRP